MITFYISNMTDVSDILGAFKMKMVGSGHLTSTLRIDYDLAPVALAFRDGGDVTFRGFQNATPDVASLVKTIIGGVRTLVTPTLSLKRHADFVAILHPNKGFTVS